MLKSDVNYAYREEDILRIFLDILRLGVLDVQLATLNRLNATSSEQDVQTYTNQILVGQAIKWWFAEVYNVR